MEKACKGKLAEGYLYFNLVACRGTPSLSQLSVLLSSWRMASACCPVNVALETFLPVSPLSTRSTTVLNND